MKKVLVASLGLLAFALPAVSHAGTVCFKDSLSPERFYVLNSSLSCTKLTKQVAVTGKLFLGSEIDCGGAGQYVPVIGACFGRPSLNTVVLGLRVIAEGPGCVSQNIHTSGSSPLGNSSGFFRLDGSSNTAITLTATPCSGAPAP